MSGRRTKQIKRMAIRTARLHGVPISSADWRWIKRDRRSWVLIYVGFLTWPRGTPVRCPPLRLRGA